MKIPTISREDLREEYINQGLSLEEIGRRHHMTAPAVRYWREKYNLPKRTHRPSDVKGGVFNMIEYIKEEYQSGRTLEDIGKDLGITSQAVSYHLRKAGIKGRDTRYKAYLNIPEDELREMYIEKNMKPVLIAAHYDVSVTTIMNKLKEYEVIK